MRHDRPSLKILLQVIGISGKNPEEKMDISLEFERLIQDTADRIGVELTADLSALRQYAADQMLALSAAIDEPGYAGILAAAGANVALHAAGSGVRIADDLDRELVGTITGALAIGARVLAGSA